VSDTSDTSARKVELAAVYKLPASLIFAGDCLGVSAPVRIAGLDGEVRLPSVKWIPDSKPDIIQPSFDELPSLAGQRWLERDRRVNDDPWFWGAVASWNPKEREVSQAEVGALVFRFNGVSAENLTYSNYLHGRGHPIGQPVDLLFGDIDAWFESLRIWLRVLTDQDIDPDVEARRVRIAAQGLEVLTVDGETVSLPRFSHDITLHMPQVQALDERHWRHALNLTSQGTSPPIEHSLVGTARVQLRLHQYRRAVIDAATAVELALTDFLNTNYASLPSGIQRTLRQNDQTLGWLIKNVPATRNLPTSVTQVFSQFPPDVETGLLDVRNDVVHRNQTLTFAEAAKTVEIAFRIVKLVKPVPKVALP
jgi:hypothetical protein